MDRRRALIAASAASVAAIGSSFAFATSQLISTSKPDAVGQLQPVANRPVVYVYDDPGATPAAGATSIASTSDAPAPSGTTSSGGDVLATAPDSSVATATTMPIGRDDDRFGHDASIDSTTSTSRVTSREREDDHDEHEDHSEREPDDD